MRNRNAFFNNAPTEINIEIINFLPPKDQFSLITAYPEVGPAAEVYWKSIENDQDTNATISKEKQVCPNAPVRNANKRRQQQNEPVKERKTTLRF